MGAVSYGLWYNINRVGVLKQSYTEQPKLFELRYNSNGILKPPSLLNFNTRLSNLIKYRLMITLFLKFNDLS